MQQRACAERIDPFNLNERTLKRSERSLYAKNLLVNPTFLPNTQELKLVIVLKVSSITEKLFSKSWLYIY